MVVSINNTDINEIEKNPYYRLCAYLNQIKQDYVGARFLLITSQYKKLDLKFVDKRVKIVNTLDYNVHNIYVQLLKFAFKCFYDILDKIACFVNEYLYLNISEKVINFHRLWYIDKKKTTINPGIEGIKNLSLNALFDIHRDFYIKNGQYGGLQKIRHSLTHRFVNVRMVLDDSNDENMTEHELISSTIKLCKVVRNTIIYLLNFVFTEECKKKKNIKGVLPSIFTEDIPDYLKYV
jgi:hypothetical protein